MACPGPRATDLERGEALRALQPAVDAGWPLAELDASVEIESGWNPSCHNPNADYPDDPDKGASGIFQAMPAILRALDYDGRPRQFRQLDARAQAAYMVDYFTKLVERPWKRPGDTYLALAASGAVGKPDAEVVYIHGGKAWRANPGWRGADGEITAGSIRAVLLRQMAKPPGKKPNTSGKKPTPLADKPAAKGGDDWKRLAWLAALYFLGQ